MGKSAAPFNLLLFFSLIHPYPHITYHTSFVLLLPWQQSYKSNLPATELLCSPVN